MQWEKLRLKKDDVAFIGEIRLHPHPDGKGVKSSHPDLHDWDKMEFGAKAKESRHAETGKPLHHLHDGIVDHIRVLPQVRPNGISTHAVYHDKAGKVVRQDAVFHVDQKAL